jgi:hypothetical protein
MSWPGDDVSPGRMMTLMILLGGAAVALTETV